MYSEKGIASFFTCIFLSSSHCGRKNMSQLGSWGESESETLLFMQKYWLENFELIWPDLDLTSVKSQVGRHRRVRRSSFDIYVQNNPENMCCVACLWALFYSAFCCLILFYIFKYGLHTHALPFLEIYQQFGWGWILCSPSDRPESPKYENAVFRLWPDIDPIHDINLKMFSIG